MQDDFAPGTVIVQLNKDGSEAKRGRRVVADPPRTARGKLRMVNSNGGISTAWWSPAWIPSNARVISSDVSV
jgi:hypothetical protein